MKKLQVSETHFSKGEDADGYHHYYMKDRMKKTKATVSPFLSQTSRSLLQKSTWRREIQKIVCNDLTLMHTREILLHYYQRRSYSSTFFLRTVFDVKLRIGKEHGVLGMPMKLGVLV